MKRYLIIPFLLFCAAAAAGQGVNYMTIIDEAQYQTASDFTNTFEIKISAPGRVPAKCQAVRIDEHWYVTAAHCISPACDEACNVEIRLVVTPWYEMRAGVTHTEKTKRVFKNSKTALAKATAMYDMALIYTPELGTTYLYSVPARNQRRISEDYFLKTIPDYNVYYKAAHGTNIPDILQVSGAAAVKIDREASVVAIWDGRRAVLPTKNPLYYMPRQKYIFTKNFGIVQGISGSGVMTNTGELLGIVSAIATLDVTDNRTGAVTSNPLVFIVPFDDFITDFIRQTSGVTNIKKAPKSILKTIPPGEAAFADAVQRAVN